jgi:hypothetical protein
MRWTTVRAATGDWVARRCRFIHCKFPTFGSVCFASGMAPEHTLDFKGETSARSRRPCPLRCDRQSAGSARERRHGRSTVGCAQLRGPTALRPGERCRSAPASSPLPSILKPVFKGLRIDPLVSQSGGIGPTLVAHVHNRSGSIPGSTMAGGNSNKARKL